MAVFWIIAVVIAVELTILIVTVKEENDYFQCLASPHVVCDRVKCQDIPLPEIQAECARQAYRIDRKAVFEQVGVYYRFTRGDWR